jgi:DNA-binding GntR family transcriptional regulator
MPDILVRVDREAGDETLTQQVMGAVRQRIASRQLATGARLPSIRGLAQGMGVSKSTVVEAYDRLAAEGMIQARRGSGFYVSSQPAPLSLVGGAPGVDGRKRDAQARLRLAAARLDAARQHAPRVAGLRPLGYVKTG